MIPINSKRGFILISFIMLCVFIIFVTGSIKNFSINKMEENIGEKTEEIKIYYRGLAFFKDDIPRGLRVHPILEDEKGIYYELHYVLGEDGKNKIKILKGSMDDMSKATQNYFEQNPNPDKTVDVDKEKFLIAVDAFTKKHEGENYYLLDFSSNSVAFKNYVLSKSNIY